MSVPSYTYYVTIGAVETQVYPSGDWSLNIAKAEEDFPFCKDYRIKFDGSFIFSGDDYDLLLASDCCDKIDLRIQCDGKNYWYGYFAYPYDLEVDEDRCQITGTPKPLDKYYCFDIYADYEREIIATKQLTYQNNFDNVLVLPGAAAWEDDCIPCEPLMDIIDDFISAPLIPFGFGGMNVKSAFFNDSTDGFPSGPYPADAGDNYVTRCPNKLNHIMYALAKNVCGLAIVAPPKVMTWNKLMEAVHNVFNTWWYIDENGEMRIEHIYFWDLYFGASYDLTTVDGGRWIVNSSKYDYTIEEIPKEERWNWSEHYNTFDPEQITYYNCYLPGISRYIKEYPLKDINTDFEYIALGIAYLLTSPDCTDLSDGEFMFIRCIENDDPLLIPYPALPGCANYVVWFSRYLDDGLEHLNAHLSSINLIANYWLHDRPLSAGHMVELNQDVTFGSTWKTLRQMELSFPVCCDGEADIILEGDVTNDPRYLYEFGIDFNENIITQYGSGELYTGTIKDGMLSLQLIFEDLACEESATFWENPCEL